MQNTQGAVFRRVCQQGNAELAKQMLAAGAAIDAPQEDGCTALWLAAEAGQVATVMLLCEAEANLEAVKQPAAVTPLYIACQNGHVAAADVLMMHSANPNTTKANGSTPMHIAAQQGFVDVCRLLLRYGAKHSPRNIQGVIPLHLAAYQGHERVVRLLLAAGADHNSESQGKFTIDWAATNGHAREIQRAIEETTGQKMAQEDVDPRDNGIVAVGGGAYYGGGSGGGAELGSPSIGTRGHADMALATNATAGRSAIRQPFMVQLRDDDSSHNAPYESPAAALGSHQPVAGWYVPSFLNQTVAGSPVREADRSTLTSMNRSGGFGSPMASPSYGGGTSRIAGGQSPASLRRTGDTRGFAGTSLPLSAVVRREEERHNAFRNRTTNNPEAGAHNITADGDAFKVRAGAGVRGVEEDWGHFKRRLDNQRRFLNNTRGSVPDGWLYTSNAVEGYRVEVEKARAELAKAAEEGRVRTPKAEGKVNNCIGLDETYVGRLRAFILEGEGAQPPQPIAGIDQGDLALMDEPPSPGQFRRAHDTF